MYRFGQLTKRNGKHVEDLIQTCCDIFMDLLEKLTNSSFRKEFIRLFFRIAWQTTI